jgi:hypothetical protein
MTAKDIRLWQLRRNPLLPGVDDFGPRRDGRNLGNVPRLDRITKDDPLACDPPG